MSSKLNRYREKVAEVINDYVRHNGYDEVMHYSQIRKILSKNLAGIDTMFQESDMCYNKTNKANLRTFSADVLLFESTDKRGYYRILGENYHYNGSVIWVRKGSLSDVIVGEWVNGKLKYWGDKIELDSDFVGSVKVVKIANNEQRLDDGTDHYSSQQFKRTTQNERFNSSALSIIDDYLKNRGIVDIKNDTNAVLERSHGKEFIFKDHLRALIYALLTNQRKWSEVEPKLASIDVLFFGYDKEKIKKLGGRYFEKGIRKLKCGNIAIKQQMSGLNDDIKVFEIIENEYGSLDAFVVSEPAADIVRRLSDVRSPYKMKGLGEALAWEYLRNVGIDGGKPDTHLRRFFGSERIGISLSPIATEGEVEQALNELSAEGSYNRFEIDYLIWCYCASGKGEICMKTPKCDRCVIRKHCSIGEKCYQIKSERN